MHNMNDTECFHRLFNPTTTRRMCYTLSEQNGWLRLSRFRSAIISTVLKHSFNTSLQTRSSIGANGRYRLEYHPGILGGYLIF